MGFQVILQSKEISRGFESVSGGFREISVILGNFRGLQMGRGEVKGGSGGFRAVS